MLQKKYDMQTLEAPNTIIGSLLSASVFEGVPTHAECVYRKQPPPPKHLREHMSKILPKKKNCTIDNYLNNILYVKDFFLHVDS